MQIIPKCNRSFLVLVPKPSTNKFVEYCQQADK